jgi:predicted signal transduction protein with EAL and GGDEF domain
MGGMAFRMTAMTLYVCSQAASQSTVSFGMAIIATRCIFCVVEFFCTFTRAVTSNLVG